MLVHRLSSWGVTKCFLSRTEASLCGSDVTWYGSYLSVAFLFPFFPLYLVFIFLVRMNINAQLIVSAVSVHFNSSVVSLRCSLFLR